MEKANEPLPDQKNPGTQRPPETRRPLVPPEMEYPRIRLSGKHGGMPEQYIPGPAIVCCTERTGDHCGARSDRK